jgi:hypothetical protein
MSFKAEVLRVLIASPSDVTQERDEIETANFEWNNLYAENLQIVLLPSRWENVAPAYSGIEGQEIINKQLVNKCDILIGVFWTKLGTPTINHSSGTLEEINNFIGQGKEIMVYFVDRDIPIGTDYNEVMKVDIYRSEFGKKGVYAPYNVNRIVNHLYQKVVDYINENNVVTIGENNVVNIGENNVATVGEDNNLSSKKLILPDTISKNEILLLGYVRETGDLKLGARWMAEKTLLKIKEWETRHFLQGELSTNYEQVIDLLAKRGLIEASEYTSHGNARLYIMPLAIYEQLHSDELSNKIDKVVVSLAELPF